MLLGKTSGLAGIAYWINENYGLSGENQVQKSDPLVQQLKEWIDAEYAGGRQTALSTAEIEEHVEKLSTGKLKRL